MLRDTDVFNSNSYTEDSPEGYTSAVEDVSIERDRQLMKKKLIKEAAEAAEANNHHPDIIINYKRITIRYWTHTASGVTLADLQMAQKINPLF